MGFSEILENLNKEAIYQDGKISYKTKIASD